MDFDGTVARFHFTNWRVVVSTFLSLIVCGDQIVFRGYQIGQTLSYVLTYWGSSQTKFWKKASLFGGKLIGGIIYSIRDEKVNKKKLTYLPQTFELLLPRLRFIFCGLSFLDNLVMVIRVVRHRCMAGARYLWQTSSRHIVFLIWN